jgi:opacity protein-like surface antigen
MRILSSVILAAGLFSAGTAIAQDSYSNPNKIYLRLDSGESFSRKLGDNYSSDAGNSVIVGGGAGYQFNDKVRSDVTVSHRSFSVKSASTNPADGNSLTSSANVHSTAVMANVYYDITKINRFTPYIGAGAGVAFNSTSSNQKSVNGALVGEDSSTTTTEPAWQVGAGTSVAITKNVSADVGYRYQDLGKVKVNTDFSPYNEAANPTGNKTNLSAHEIQAGVRYNF